MPARPRLAPDRAVVGRGAGRVQIGLDPRAAVVLDGLTPPLAALVGELDGSRRADELVARAVAAGGDAGAARTLLGRLAAAGLLRGAGPPLPRTGPDAARAGAAARTPPPDDADVLVPRAVASVVVEGGGRVAVAAAGLLAAAGVGRVHLTGARVVTAADTGTGLLPADVGRPVAAAGADAVRRAAPEVVTTAPARRRPDLVLLADVEVVDPARAARLARRGQPHLVARVREGVGVVGPLVVPGRSACLGCLERARAAADPRWPTVAAQLVGRVTSAPVATATATAALAAEQALLFLDAPHAPAGAPPLLGTVLELDPRRVRWRRRAVGVHPDCPCGAAADVARPA